MIDKSKLKELAIAATPGPWDFDTAETPFKIAGGEVVGGDALPYGDVYTTREYETPEGSEPLIVAQEIGAANGRYIAAANPVAILELLAELEARKLDYEAAPGETVIKTWQERLGPDWPFLQTKLCNDEMLAEIADLRAALATRPRAEGGNTKPESFAVELGRESIAARTQADAGKAGSGAQIAEGE